MTSVGGREELVNYDLPEAILSSLSSFLRGVCIEWNISISEETGIQYPYMSISKFMMKGRQGGNPRQEPEDRN